MRSLLDSSPYTFKPNPTGFRPLGDGGNGEYEATLLLDRGEGSGGVGKLLISIEFVRGGAGGMSTGTGGGGGNSSCLEDDDFVLIAPNLKA